MNLSKEPILGNESDLHTYTLGRIFFSWAGQDGGGTAETEQPLGLIDHFFLNRRGGSDPNRPNLAAQLCEITPTRDIQREIVSR